MKRKSDNIVKMVRVKHGWTIKQLARTVVRSVRTVEGWEYSGRTIPDSALKVLLALLK